jgi:hypothetical protein
MKRKGVITRKLWRCFDRGDRQKNLYNEILKMGKMGRLNGLGQKSGREVFWAGWSEKRDQCKTE